jgi:hypothetical protein
MRCRASSIANCGLKASVGTEIISAKRVLLCYRANSVANYGLIFDTVSECACDELDPCSRGGRSLALDDR